MVLIMSSNHYIIMVVDFVFKGEGMPFQIYKWKKPQNVFLCVCELRWKCCVMSYFGGGGIMEGFCVEQKYCFQRLAVLHYSSAC